MEGKISMNIPYGKRQIFLYLYMKLCMATDLQMISSFLEEHFCEEIKKYERGGRLENKIHTLFCGETHKLLQLHIDILTIII
jgi:hypothetical protein